ncbi:NAD(P)H-dependent flavin oxidoreductase [Paracoccus yeei]|uniref:Nitronate monooxygenase n=1 Tax=Paracoccus yeei TaxID=147645 RepID=A0A2D2C7N5_9RHOB|nr:nitronate monooxygenase [Paracoccus yeei]ATQ58528.1 nitronate monooxygenase [Paracoccus yeei]
MLEALGVSLPIIQAPMAGVSTPRLAAAVSNAGGLGSLGVGATDAAGARAQIEDLRGRTDRPFNVNVFVHATPVPDAKAEAAWIAALAPLFAEFGAAPPSRLRPIYRSFADDPDMLALLLELRPPVVSFHFGLPSAAAIAALKGAGILLLATATSPEEARAIEAAGLDGIVAQGIEAGGHRGIFDPDAPDDGLGTLALTRLLVRGSRLPVIAAGGIMDGAGIRAALDLGAVAAQLGTAFVPCPESSADEAYRAALMGPGAAHTLFTAIVSGRPARSLPTRFTALAERLGGLPTPGYPATYDAGKALHAAARARGETGFGAQWAGQGAPLARAMPAAELMATLARELRGEG